MPAPIPTSVCGYCTNVFPGTAVAAFTLVPTVDGYDWSTDTGPVARAREETGLWHVFGAETGERSITLVAVQLDAGMRVALLDAWLRTTATVVVEPTALPRLAGSRRGLGFVRNRRDETVLAVYGDGPTGVHLVNREEAVVALASPLPGRRGGLDVLVTKPQSAPAPIVLGGVLLSLELARVGQLRPVG
jgi:hypothetical protein